MSKQKKRKSNKKGNQNATSTIVLVTATINLLIALINLINKLTD